MRKRSDALHLDRVHILKRVIQNAGGVDDLPAEVLVVEVPNEEAFGGKGVRLDIDVRSGDLVDEGRLADVRVSTDEEGARIRINGGQPGDVLPDLFEVSERVFLPAHDRGHSAGTSLSIDTEI